MEATALQNLFIEILRCELNEVKFNNSVKSQLTPDIISALFLLAKRHDLAHIVSSCLYKNGLLTDGEMLAKFSKEEITSVYRHEQIKFAYSQICGILNKNSIEYIPLKGSVIRPYYPKESMRTSCDIDILIKEEMLDKAVNALMQNGFSIGQKGYHDVSLYSKNGIHLELHFNILENDDKMDEVLKNAWQYAIPDGESCYKFSNEFFLLHTFAHIAYHFLSGGCGVRSLMDIWIIKNKMGLCCEQSKELLQKAGIYKFATELENLVQVCFSGEKGDDFSDILLSYIINGGVYGTSNNRIKITNAQTSNTFFYGLKRLFPPYYKMIAHYPVLKNVPFLLPFCWIARLTKKLFLKKSGMALSELKTVSNISQTQVDIMKEMRTRLEI